MVPTPFACDVNATYRQGQAQRAAAHARNLQAIQAASVQARPRNHPVSRRAASPAAAGHLFGIAWLLIPGRVLSLRGRLAA